jgi:hypothetical protein
MTSRARDLERGNLWEFHQISHSGGRVVPPAIVDPKNKVAFPDSLSYGTQPEHGLLMKLYNFNIGVNMDGKLIDLKEQWLSHPLSLVLVTQKRLVSAFMSEKWRAALKARHPEIPTFEVLFFCAHLFCRIS